MSKVVNLNKTRKARARADKKVRAQENAVKFGRTKSENNEIRIVAERAARDIDGHKRE